MVTKKDKVEPATEAEKVAPKATDDMPRWMKYRIANGLPIDDAPAGDVWLRPEPLIQRLEQKQAELAHTALATPNGRDAFEYGRMAGVYQGYGLAIDMIKNIEAETEERGRDL